MTEPANHHPPTANRGDHHPRPSHRITAGRRGWDRILARCPRATLAFPVASLSTVFFHHKRSDLRLCKPLSVGAQLTSLLDSKHRCRTRYIAQNPQTRTDREADWWSGSCGATGDDALTAPGGVR